MQNQKAYQEHRQAIKDLAAALGNARSDSEARWLRRTIRRVREELFQLVVRDLEDNSASYSPISDRFKNGASDLKRVRNRIGELQIAANTISRLVSWASNYLPLL